MRRMLGLLTGGVMSDQSDWRDCVQKGRIAEKVEIVAKNYYVWKLPKYSANFAF